MMTSIRFSLTAMLLVLTGCSGLLAAEPTSALAPIPNVLVLGDSIYSQPTNNAAAILRGRVNLQFATLQPGEVRNTHQALRNLDNILGDQSWDLIHFNFGLGDLVYRAPNMKAFRVLPKTAGGIRTTSPALYEKNLRSLVARLKATGSKLIWASTTPIRHSSTGVFDMESEIEYNAIAKKIMLEHGVPINDMYSHVLNLIDMDKPAAHGADPFYFDRKPLYPPIVVNVLRELDLIQPVHGPVQVFIMAGGWSHIGGGIVVDVVKPRPGQNRGTLDHMVLEQKNASDYGHLLDEEGKWKTRSDVWIHFDRRGPKSGALGIGYGGDRKRCIGSELSFGIALGDHIEQQVCIIKTALGTPSLASDLKSPNAGGHGQKPGTAYTNLLKQINESLDSLSDKFPDYTNNTGYELAGLVLNVGEQDSDPNLYGEHLKALIADLRAELKTPKLPCIIVGTGRGGHNETEFPQIIQIQQHIASLPEHRGNVAFVETRDFWPAEDARDAYRHPSNERWFDNAESFYLMGKAIGDQMIKMLP
jgi:hypothetical protein